VTVPIPVAGGSPGSSTSVARPASARLAGSATTAAGDTSIIKVAAAVGPTVVTIQVGSGRGLGGQAAVGSGSGVIIRKDGWILTNRHVVEGARSVSVILADGRAWKGTVKAVAANTDLALVKIGAANLPTARLGDSSGLQVGQAVVAIGSPLGEFPGTVTAGIVSGLERSLTVSDGSRQTTEDLQHLIQVDAAINPGNSGGPLLDLQGKVIGIDTAQASDAQGIGFALPIGLAKPFIAKALRG
jgi:serine protease Do